MIEIYLLVSACLLIPISIGWFINCVTSYRIEKQYNEFYQNHAIRKRADVVYYEKEIMRSTNGYIYHIVLKFLDEEGNEYSVSLNTNHHSAKKYSKTKVDDFLCLFDAIKSDYLSFDHIDSNAPEKWRAALHGIPLVVLPAEENFVLAGRIDRLKTIIFILSVFVIVGIFLMVGERLTDSMLRHISLMASGIIPFIAVLIPISRLIFSRCKKH
ncbi:MAG: hypothetical protein IJ740_15195 [Ruminococcus sp.]|nr:hypothetical protein [Ruminococcus sp.]